MYRSLLFIPSFVLFFLFPGNILQAQESGSYTSMKTPFPEYSRKKQTDAHITYSIENGALRNVYTPELTHRYGAYISSAYPLKLTVLSGEAGYTRYYRKGQRYCGMFRPAYPLITFADTLPGNQKGETYHLAGSIVHSFSTHWNAGITLEYLAGNNAKDIDPRNKNGLNRITVVPDFQYFAGTFQLGTKLYWQYERETVSYNSFGSETKNGVTFYPLWFYTAESFADGLNSQRDYRSDLYKIEINLQYKGNTWQTAFYPSYSQRNTCIWINPAKKQSAGEIAKVNFCLENETHISASRHTHRFMSRFSHSRYKIYDIQQQLSADNRIYETILKIKRAGVSRISAGFHYMISPISHPDRTVKISLEYKKRNSLFRLPPTDFNQEITRLNFSAGYTRSFLLSGHLLNSGLQTSYSTGYGTQPDLSPLSGESIFRVQRHTLDREFQYLTVSTFGITTKLRYTFPVNDCQSDFYIEIQDRFHTTCRTSGWSARSNDFKFSAGVSF